MSQEIGIGIIGCGVVGSAVARILLEQRAELAARTGVSPVLRHVVVRDVHRPRPLTLPDGMLTAEPARMMADDQTAIVVELAGGVGRRTTFTADWVSS